MKTRENLRVDDSRWRKLCELVAIEPDPKRLSQLLDELLKELDAPATHFAKATRRRTRTQTISDLWKSHLTCARNLSHYRTRAHGLKLHGLRLLKRTLEAADQQLRDRGRQTSSCFR